MAVTVATMAIVPVRVPKGMQIARTPQALPSSHSPRGVLPRVMHQDYRIACRADLPKVVSLAGESTRLRLATHW